MHVDDVVEAIYQRLCIHEQDRRLDADRSMGLDELRLALGVSEALMNEALWVLTFPGDKRIVYPKPGRVALGPDWRAPATAARPVMDPRYVLLTQSITSIASLAVWATYSRPCRPWTAAWSNPPGR